MPPARIFASSHSARTSASSGVMSMRSRLAFSTRKGSTSRLLATIRPTAKSSASSTVTIRLSVRFSHSSRADATSPRATSAAFSAPMEVP